MISHEHKCIFIHIPKTAGMSINSYFHPGIKFHHENPDYERLFGWCPERQIHMQHATAKQLLDTELITEYQWKNYYKFTFVRNPWDRAYSDFLFIKSFAKINGNFKDYLSKQGPFEHVLKDNSGSHYLGDHLINQTSFFDIEGKFQLDFVGRFESFSEDIEKVLTRLNIRGGFNVFLNKSKNRYSDYSKFYTNSNKKLITEIYKKDIDCLNYSFVDNRTGFFFFKKLM